MPYRSKYRLLCHIVPGQTKDFAITEHSGRVSGVATPSRTVMALWYWITLSLESAKK